MRGHGVHVAVVGATGVVGQEMLSILDELRFPTASLKLLASEHSTGKSLLFRRKPLAVEQLSPDAFRGIDVALFSAGADVSREFAPIAAKSGAFVIDNSSAFRMASHIPLVVPEVNPHDVLMAKEHRILANPNCSTIQMVVVLSLLRNIAPLRRVVVSSYQSTSGAGKEGVDELLEQMRCVIGGRAVRSSVFPHQIAFNCIPQIDDFESDGFTREEHKLMRETEKILHDASIRVLATAVRVPSIRSHALSVAIEFEKEVSVEGATELLRRSSSVVVMDDGDPHKYPTPLHAAHRDPVFVGRMRRDPTVPHGLALWIVADNVRKGAALNAVQIALLLREHGLL